MGSDHAGVTGGESALNRAVRGRLWSSTSVMLSHLGCLSSLVGFACSSFL